MQYNYEVIYTGIATLAPQGKDTEVPQTPLWTVTSIWTKLPHFLWRGGLDRLANLPFSFWIHVAEGETCRLQPNVCKPDGGLRFNFDFINNLSIWMTLLIMYLSHMMREMRHCQWALHQIHCISINGAMTCVCSQVTTIRQDHCLFCSSLVPDKIQEFKDILDNRELWFPSNLFFLVLEIRCISSF